MYNPAVEAAQYHVTNGQAGWMNTASHSPELRYQFLCALRARLLHWIDKIEEEQERAGYKCVNLVQTSADTCSASSIEDTHLPFVGTERLERIR